MPAGLKIKQDGEFLGEEIFLIEVNNQVAIIFLTDKYKDSYDINKAPVYIKGAFIQPEKISEKIILKDIMPVKSNVLIWAGSVILFIIVFLFILSQLRKKVFVINQRKKIRYAVKDNNFEFILKKESKELEILRAFLSENLYRKEWETVHRLEYEKLKREFLNV